MFSDGTATEYSSFYRDLEAKLAVVQSARKTRQVKAIDRRGYEPTVG